MNIQGRIYDIDLSLGGKRIRQSLHTDNKLKASAKTNEKKEKLLNEYKRNEVKFDDFCEQGFDRTSTAKSALSKREEQRLEKIKEFFKSLDLIYLSEITLYHMEQLKAELKKTDHMEESYLTTKWLLELTCHMKKLLCFNLRQLRPGFQKICSCGHLLNKDIFLKEKEEKERDSQ